uniref:Chalcone isomerase domain-containing protein n=1 Tax=Hanusia phi TaxID=3032 RepID=A0A7S0EJQ9_9CRYP
MLIKPEIGSSHNTGNHYSFFKYALSATSAAVLASLMLQNPEERRARSEEIEQPKLVAELVTGMKFPLTLEMPPFQVTPYQGQRAGYVYKMGPKGVGYYPDAHRGGNKYVNVDTESKQQHLIGIGMRCMLQKCEFALAQAYAIGLYIDESFLEDASQGQTKHLDSRPLEDPRVRKTLRLVMAREVKGPHIAKGFDRTLINVLRKLTNSKKSPGKDALKKFTSIFSNCGTLQQNDDVMLYMPGDGSLTIFIRGESRGRIDSQLLCDAIMEMYIGSKPVGPLIRSNFIAGYAMAAKDGLANVQQPPGSVPCP